MLFDFIASSFHRSGNARQCHSSGFTAFAAFDHVGFWTPKTVRVAARELGFGRCHILWREKGYTYPRLTQTVFHRATQFLACATRGAIHLATVFQAEMWKSGGS